MKMTRCSGLWKNISGKADMVGKLADTLHPDAVIQFCHWGCKQSSGGSLLLKEKLNEMNIPMLILDGDGIDRIRRRAFKPVPLYADGVGVQPG